MLESQKKIENNAESCNQMIVFIQMQINFSNQKAKNTKRASYINSRSIHKPEQPQH